MSYVAPNTDHFISRYPAATDGSISQASEHQITETNCSVSLHPKKCYVFRKKSCTVVTVLLKYVNMSSNQVGDEKSEEAATRKQALETGILNSNLQKK